ncbi:MAG: 30S ribosomal protein S20 [Sphingomonadales bacterium]|nr:30S ribosomal protein S20 [Sphingomonadales bacterium]
MANSPQAKKRIRTAEKRTAVNKNRVSRIRTFIKGVETALVDGDKDAAKVAMKAAEPEIARGVTKGVIKKKTASRKISRLSAAVKKLA